MSSSGSDDLIAMTYAEAGTRVDGDSVALRIREAVGEVVKSQRRPGLNIVNDEETSKPS
jgi:hypothetical protein